MTVRELNRSQLRQLKARYYDLKLYNTEHRSINYMEGANIDQYVTDEEIFDRYEGVTFTDDDFCNVSK